MIAAAKFATILGWLAILINILVPFGSQIEIILYWSGIGLAAAHTLEMFIFLPKAKKLDGNLSWHALQLFIFGYAHNMTLDQLSESNEQ